MLLAEDLIAQGHVDLASSLLAVPVFAKSQSGAVSRPVARVQSECIAATEDDTDRGIRSYNLANALRAQGEYRSAVRAYLTARRYEPEYMLRHYSWRELASCFFMLGHFQWAAEAYGRALTCDPPETPAVAGADDPEEAARRYWLTPIRGFYADALMHAGRYAEAEVEFERYRAESEEPEGEWLLTEMVLSELLGDGLIEDRPRRRTEAMGAASVVEQKVDAEEWEEARQLIEAAVPLDPLEPELWRLSEIVENEIGTPATLVFSQAMLAISSGSLDPWATAAINSFSAAAGGPHIMVALVLSGYQRFRARFLERIAHLLRTEGGLSSEEVGVIRAASRMIVDREFTLAEARDAGLPIPKEMGDGPIPLFYKSDAIAEAECGSSDDHGESG